MPRKKRISKNKGNEILEKKDPLQSAAALRVERINYLISKMREGKNLTQNELNLISVHIDDLEEDSGNERRDRFNNAQRVADHYGVKPPTVYEHVRRGNIKMNADGTFDKKETDKYYCEKRGQPIKPIAGSKNKANGENGNGESKAVSNNGNSLQRKIDAERLRKMRAEATTKELMAAQMRGTLISRDDMIKVWCTRIEMFKEAITHLSVRLPPLLVNLSQNEIEKILRDEAESIMRDFSKHGKFTPKRIIREREKGSRSTRKT